MRRTRGSYAALAAALVVAAAIGLLHLRAYRTLSPIDELQHIDAVDRAPAVVRRGALVGEVAMREEACRGIDAAFVPPACDAAPLRPGDFQEGGYNTAYIHPTLHYTVTALAGAGFEQLPGVDGLVAGARIASVGWLLLGLVLVWLLLCLGDVAPAGQFGVLLLLATAPLVVHASTTVNPDASALAAGASVFVLYELWRRGLARTWLFVPLVLVIVSLKFTHVAGVIAIATVALAAALADWWPQRQLGAEGRRSLGLVVVLAASVLAGQAFWSAIQDHYALVSREAIPMVVTNQVESFEFVRLARELHTMFTPLHSAYIPPRIYTGLTELSLQVGDLLGLGAVASAFALSRADRRERIFAAGIVTTLVGLGPFMALAFFVSSRLGSPVPTRYGIAVIPGIVACAIPLLRNRQAAAVAAALGVLSALSMLRAVA